MTGFFVEVAAVATELEQDVVSGLKAGIQYVDNVFVSDIEPVLIADLKQLATTFGTQVLSDLFKQIVPGATLTVPTPSPAAQATQ